MLTTASIATLIAALAISATAATGATVSGHRSHYGCHRHHHRRRCIVDKKPMTVAGMLSGGGEIAVRLHWASADTKYVGPHLFIETVSISDVPALCLSHEDDEETYRHTKDLVGSEIFNATTEVPGTPLEVEAPETLASIGIRIGEYDEESHTLQGSGSISEQEGAPLHSFCTANNLPADFALILPHNWYGR